MTSRESEYNRYLHKLSENLDISDTMRDKAIESYTAVGNWLGDCADNSSVKIMPQGSFYLGTVIKPVSDADDYDIDLVCLLKEKAGATEYEIKHLVGDRLKEHEKYADMLDEKEGKRCWTLHYDEFHMDILPCAPKDGIYDEPCHAGIRLTHKTESGVYIPKYSNPYKYHVWFEERMKVRLMEEKRQFAARNQVEITKVPLHRVKTPLQRAIQLLKRHRDIMYHDKPRYRQDDAPISIIITTLAARAYNNEGSIFEALKSILENMQQFIEVRDGAYWIANPVMPEENFAEKWNEEPNKHVEFKNWLVQARQEILVEPFGVAGLHCVSESLQRAFGRSMVERTLIDMGNQTRVDRDEGNLYVTGLTGGLTRIADKNSQKAGGHTFFGE